MATEQEKNIKFVKEIQKYAFLYNYKLPEYMRKTTTDRTWAKIGDKFGMTGPEAKEKWKNLRSVFARHLKPPKSVSAKKKPYYLARYMQFAVPFIKTVATPSGNLQETTPFADDSYILQQQSPEFCDATQFQENVTSNTQSISQQQFSFPSSSTRPILQHQSYFLSPSTQSLLQQASQLQSSLPSTNTHSITHQQSSLPSCTCSQSISKINKKKRKRSEETQVEKDISSYFRMKQSILKENCGNTENSNRMFLLSLVTDMNKMNDNQRRLYKRRMLEVMDEIFDQTGETGNSGTPSPMSSPTTIYYGSTSSLILEENEEETHL